MIVESPYWEPKMRDDRTGNEPSPVVLFGLAVIPIIATLAWFAFG